MLFDLRSKDSKEELYGRDDEIEEFTSLLRSGNWVAVLGTRMIGKTSLIKVALSEIEKKSKGKKRYEGIYVSLYGVNSLSQLLVALTNALNSKHGLVRRIKGFLENIASFHLGPDGVTLETSSKPMNTLSDIFAALGKSSPSSNYVIALDEVQELAPVSGQLLKLLGNVFNTYRNIVFVFSGSSVGLIKILLEPESTSPLYGRPPAKIILRPFMPEVSRNFLHAGFKECNVTLGADMIQEVVDKLDGIVGWHTLFGNNYALRKLKYPQAIKGTVDEGKRIVLGELDHFLEGRQKDTYMAILKTIKSAGVTGSSWSQIKSGAEVRLARSINNQTLANVIDAFRSAGILEQLQENYVIVDPLLKEAL